MKLHRAFTENGYLSQKAGIIPFLADGRALFVVSSNVAYGGTDPAIAKGQIDRKEDSMEAAIREGEEELGLKKNNMAAQPWLCWSGMLSGLTATYPMDVYAVLVKNQNDFGKPDKETARTLWLTRSQFEIKGRKSHVQIMVKVFDKIEVYLKDK